MSVRENNVYPGPVTETAPSTSFNSSLEPIPENTNELIEYKLLRGNTVPGFATRTTPAASFNSSLEPIRDFKVSSKEDMEKIRILAGRDLYGKLEELSFQSIRYFIIFKLLEKKLKQTRPDLVAPLDILTSFCIQTHNLLFKYGITDTEKLKQLNITVIDEFFANPSEISEEKRKEFIGQFIKENVINQLIATSVYPNVSTLVYDEMKNFVLTKLLTLNAIVAELIPMYEDPNLVKSSLNAFVIGNVPGKKPTKYKAALKAAQLLEKIQSFHSDMKSEWIQKKTVIKSLKDFCQKIGIDDTNCQRIDLLAKPQKFQNKIIDLFTRKRKKQIRRSLKAERKGAKTSYNHVQIPIQDTSVFSGPSNTFDKFIERFGDLLFHLDQLSFDLLKNMPVLSIVTLKAFKDRDKTKLVAKEYEDFIAGVSDVIVSDTQFFTQEQLNRKDISLNVPDPEADRRISDAKKAKEAEFKEWKEAQNTLEKQNKREGNNGFKSEATRYGIITFEKYEQYKDMIAKITRDYGAYRSTTTDKSPTPFEEFKQKYLQERLLTESAAAEPEVKVLPAINEAGGAAANAAVPVESSGGARRRLRSRKRNGKKSQRGGVKKRTNKRKNIRGRVRKSNKPRRKKAKKLSKKLRKN